MTTRAFFLPCCAVVMFAGCDDGSAPADTPTYCGNGIVDVDEVCDDGNTMDGDGCASNCQSNEICGNGVVDVSVGEACDDGNAVDGDGCRADCSRPECGDDVVDAGEVCDDGNRLDGDGCSATCMSAETCGNGVVDTAIGEACDGGDNVNGDGCSATCQLEYCGNGTLDPYEACDDGNYVDGDGCSATCDSNETCGNGILDPGEHCDDGNAFSGDSCPSTCRLPQFIVAAGTHHTCALREDGSVKCWGRNARGQLGLGDTVQRGDEPGEMGTDLATVNLSSTRTAVAISAGDSHTCAVLDDGAVKCWGNNGGYQGGGTLGLGDVRWRGDDPDEMGDNLPAVDLGAGQKVVTVAAGSHHTCALLYSGAVKCWGMNWFGQLGLGDVEWRGDTPDDMGDNLPAVDLGSGSTVIDIAAGWMHSCALLDDGSVKCWGNNGSGQLGLGDTYARGATAGSMGDELPTVELGSGRTAVAVAAGGDSTCALLDDASVKCWGDNEFGQLGLGDTRRRGDDPGEMGDELPAVDLGTGATARSVTIGFHHTCARLDDGSIKCWGNDGAGQLGLGDTLHRGDDAGEMGDELPSVDLGVGRTAISTACDYSRSCAVLDDHTLKCWGTNQYGQLGLGDTVIRGDDPGEMGDDLPAVDLGP